MKKSSGYRGNITLKDIGEEIPFTKEQVNEYYKCMRDPIYLIQKYVKVIHPDRGLIPFDIYDYQKEFLELVFNNRFVISLMPRQMGKSTTICSGFYLHKMLFEQNQSFAILANKESTAIEMISRFKTAYMNLPKWLQQGVLTWNKKSVELENGNKIQGFSTSSDAVRGLSFTSVLADEFAFVKRNIQDEFFSSVYPTISAGNKTQLIMVSTPKGMEMFYKYWVDSIEGRNGYKNYRVYWHQHPDRGEEWAKQTKENVGELRWRQEYECEFLGSQNTLFDVKTMQRLVYKKPKEEQPEIGLKLYESPVKDNQYLMTVDVSRGKGIDYHAFSIFDVTEFPMKQVCTFRNNEMSPIIFPKIIFEVARKFNNAYVLVENNIGDSVPYALFYEFEYENIISTRTQGRMGQQITFGFGNKSNLGVSNTKKIKLVGCNVIKSMIEQDKLILNDFDTISELTTFISKGKSYEADRGYHDDMITTLILFGWCIEQPYFKDLKRYDLRKEVYEDQIKELEEELLPFGFYDNGSNDIDNFNDGSSDSWSKVY